MSKKDRHLYGVGEMSTSAHRSDASKGTKKKQSLQDLSLDEQLQAEALQRKLLLRKKIGSGAFSVVFEASWLAPSVMPWASTRTFAAKCLYKDQDLKRIEDELRFLRMLRYDHRHDAELSATQPFRAGSQPIASAAFLRV